MKTPRAAASRRTVTLMLMTMPLMARTKPSVRPQGTLVSVFCHGAQAEGVTLRGLQYPLEGALLTCDHPLGVSNAYTKAQAASVTVARGTLLVYVALDA